MKKILYFILGFLVLIFACLVYSRFIGTKALDVKEIVVNTNILESYDGLKIVHFTDLHYKKIIDEDMVKKLVEKINKTKPDLIVFTGDLVDDMYEMNNSDTNFLIEELASISAKYGKYAILGDQDYLQKEIVQNIYMQSDFNILDNSSTIIYNEKKERIILMGFGSDLKNDFKLDNINDIEDSLYKIALVHEGDNATEVLEKFPNTSLILGGHSINGSINIPLIKNVLLPEGANKYYKPYYKLDNTDIYISNGIGVNNINFRFNNHPTFNLYRLKKSDI